MTTRPTHDPPHPPRNRAAGVLLSLVLAAASAAAGCAAVGGRKSPPPPLPPTQPVAGTIVGSAVRFDLRPLGFVPSDGVTLPLLSPDGRHMAVQTGVAPDLATALARQGQRAPLASRIAMYRVEGRALVRLGETDGGLILGRSADNRGFLVESVRPDGTRWIGRIDWSSRETEWLVQDGNVHAFAALGADGTLVHASRPLNGRQFDLVIRKDGQTRRLPGDGTRSYLLPCLSADGTRVLAFSLRDGILELVSANHFFGVGITEDSKTKRFNSSMYNVIVFDEIFLMDTRKLARIKKYMEANPDKIILATGDTRQLEPVDPMTNNHADTEAYTNSCVDLLFRDQLFLCKNKRLKSEEDREKLERFTEDIFDESIPPEVTVKNTSRLSTNPRPTSTSPTSMRPASGWPRRRESGWASGTPTRSASRWCAGRTSRSRGREGNPSRCTKTTATRWRRSRGTV